LTDYELKQFISENKSIIIRTIWRYVRREEDMEEILQEAIIIVWKKNKLFNLHPNPKALLKKICINISIDFLRKESKRKNDIEIINNIELVDSNLKNHIEYERIKKIVINSIALLSKKQSLAVLLRLIEEKTYEEIAIIMNCSEATVRTHVKRGRKKLKKKLNFLNGDNYGK